MKNKLFRAAASALLTLLLVGLPVLLLSRMLAEFGVTLL